MIISFSFFRDISLWGSNPRMSSRSLRYSSVIFSVLSFAFSIFKSAREVVSNIPSIGCSSAVFRLISSIISMASFMSFKFPFNAWNDFSCFPWVIVKRPLVLLYRAKSQTERISKCPQSFEVIRLAPRALASILPKSGVRIVTTLSFSPRFLDFNIKPLVRNSRIEMFARGEKTTYVSNNDSSDQFREE